MDELHISTPQEPPPPPAGASDVAPSFVGHHVDSIKGYSANSMWKFEIRTVKPLSKKQVDGIVVRQVPEPGTKMVAGSAIILDVIDKDINKGKTLQTGALFIPLVIAGLLGFLLFQKNSELNEARSFSQQLEAAAEEAKEVEDEDEEELVEEDEMAAEGEIEDSADVSDSEEGDGDDGEREDLIGQIEIVDEDGMLLQIETLRAISPERLLDTRASGNTVDGEYVGNGKLDPEDIFVLDVAGRGSVADETDTAILNVTATNTEARGFVTVWPCDGDRPNASNLNFAEGSTAANAVVTSLDAEGSVCIASSARADIVVDIQGFMFTEFVES